MRSLRHGLLILLIVCTSSLAVGLTAPADAPFSIVVHASFLRIERGAGAAGRPRALVVDVALKCGSFRYHVGWPGFLVAAVSTASLGTSL